MIKNTEEIDATHVRDLKGEILLLMKEKQEDLFKYYATHGLDMETSRLSYRNR